MSSVTVERLPDEPIILARFEGQVDEALMRQMYQQSDDLLSGMHGRVYRVSDFSYAYAEFDDLMAMVNEAGKAAQRHNGIRHISVAIVGNDEMLNFGVKMLSQLQYGGQSLPIFKSVDAALNHVRQQIGETTTE